MTTAEFLSDIDKSLNVECHSVIYPEECGKIINKHYIKVFHVNIQSVQHNFESFLIIFARLNISFDVIVFSECWINEFSAIKQIEGYKSYNTSKYINKSGGVIVYINNKWSANVTEPDIEDANGLIVEVPNVFSLIGIYRSPSFRNSSKFISSLEANLKSIKNSPCLIFVGDININILGQSANEKNTSSYLNLLAAHGLISCVDKPTHMKSCIDHIFVSAACHSESIVCPTDLTNHSLTMAGVTVAAPKMARVKRSRLKIDYEGLKAEVAKINWPVITSGSVLEDVVSNFSSALTDAVSMHSHVVRISHSKFNLKPWMTPGLIRCSKHRDKLHSEARKNPNNNLKKIAYTRYRNFYVKLLRKLKTEYECNLIDKNKNVPRKLWKTLNTISHRAVKKSNISLQDISLDACNKHFATVGEKLANEILARSNETQQSLAEKVSTKGSLGHSFFIAPTDREEVLQLIKNLSSNSSPGLDNLDNRILKAVGEWIADPLAIIFNLSIELGIFPMTWKVAAVTPIHKGGPRNDPSNYRPISLLGNISKLLERIINKRLMHFLETNHLINDRQFGFRRGRSTENAVTLLTNTVSSHLDKGQKCIGVFLDLAKAFDSISIPILTKKLELYGIRGNCLKWFADYLTNRQQCVRISGQESSLRTVRFGVPQGSILGPTLFMLYINDISLLNILNADILCYADDTAIVFWDESWPGVCRRAEDGMALVSRWLDTNLLSLNTSKTKFLCFHKTAASAPTALEALRIPSATCQTQRHSIPCICKRIERKGSLKYLGVVLDDRLTFRDHVVEVSNRVRKLFHVMRNLRDAVDGRILKMVYLALCQPLINYCILAWGGASSEALIPLERAQRGVLKVALNKPMRYPTTALYNEAGVLSVRRLYLVRVIVSVHKSVVNSKEYEQMLRKRVFKIPHPQQTTSFAHRFEAFLFPHVYNKLVNICNFKYCTTREAKALVSRTLLTWTYEESENLIKVPK